MNSIEKLKFEKSPEEIKRDILEKFISYRDNYIDDLPPERLKPSDENYHLYKCRGNFFQGMVADVENLLNEGGVISDSETVDKCKEFLEYASKIDFSKFTTEKDIDKANEIIECIIESLQDKS